jgi:DNA replication and repair protein RecF
MFLKTLKLTNFRNYSNLTFDFDEKPTILIGNNAVGKSNFLESIYFLSTTKSGRADSDLELIKKEESVTLVEGDLIEEDKNEPLNLEITMQLVDGQLSKKVKVNGVPRRVVDFVGNLPGVLFSPTDINMITGSPSLRRWHLDLCLSQVDSTYKKSLTLYEQVVTSRNRVLKRIRDDGGGMEELTYWTDELLKYGQVVADGRKAFLESVNSQETPLGKFIFDYLQSELSLERLEQYSSREIASAQTLIGPHRDDFKIMAGERNLAHFPKEKRQGESEGRNLAHFGSRGEQRIATLAFKLAQLEYMALVLGKRPILLLDDVFSELDAKHRKQVVDIVSRQQTVLATVELENIPKAFIDSSRMIHVDNGKITE